jgi:hypothetical protein
MYLSTAMTYTDKCHLLKIETHRWRRIAALLSGITGLVLQHVAAAAVGCLRT